jgi:4-aminobutyrate aminotransferase-like enzyme
VTGHTSDLAARRDRALGAGAPLFYDTPIEIVRGEGVHLFDAEDRRYLDLYNNVPCVGHANARVVDAMARQQATLNVHSRYLHEGIVELAERLTDLHRPAIESAVFSCSGTEANEVALHIARTATAKRGIIATDAAYHGNSEAVIALTQGRSGSGPHPDVRMIPFPERYRPLVEGASDEALADACLARLGEAIEDLERTEAGFAGVLFCSLFANEGLPDVPAGFMARAGEMVRSAGGLVIADEVQAGYGRSGQWWGYETNGYEPDIVVTGKPMGNGLPLAATCASRDLVEAFRRASRYFNTFAASPLQAAVGMTVLDVIEDERLVANAATVGHQLKSALADRSQGHPWIGDVRGTGLFVGIEMVTDPDSRRPDRNRAADVANRLKDKGFLTSNAGAHANVLKIRPPLILGADQAAEFVDAYAETLAELDG